MKILLMLQRLMLPTLVVFAAGCGSGSEVKTYPVAGEVFVDGQPAVGAEVMFHAPNVDPNKIPIPRGRVGEDGRFTLTTYNADDGAPPGEYKVTVFWPKMVKRGNDDMQGPDQLKEKYASRNKSTLAATVEAKSNTIPRFNLTP